MKHLEIKRIPDTKRVLKISDIDLAMDTMETCPIDTICWEEYRYKPTVNFTMAYGEREIFLKYYVQEKYILAENNKSNHNVYEDSCVEFFFSPYNDGIYYNFEFNCIGVCLAQVGASRNDRQPIDVRLIHQIRSHSTLGDQPFEEKKGAFSWEMTIAIPFSTMSHHEITDISGLQTSANFYKCGDKLTEPHYLSWNHVKSLTPDFHRPEFFGTVFFN